MYFNGMVIIGNTIICRNNMELRARIISSNGVDVIDFDQETAIAEQAYGQSKAFSGLTHELITELLGKSPEDLTDQEQGLLEILSSIEAEHERSLVRLNDYLLFTQSDLPECNDTDTPLPYYAEIDGAVVQYWNITPNDPVKVEAKINSLISELSSTDYQVIKNYEYTMAGITCEYDPQTLYANRTTLRNQINTLKSLLT